MKAESPSSARRAARVVCVVVALIVLSACYREASEPESFYLPYTGTAPLAIRGLSPGQSEDDVIALLGPPDRRNVVSERFESLQWSRLPDLVATVDTRTRWVTEVLGNQLDAAGEAVVSSGMSAADVRAVLGKPATSKGRFQPSGSGVISIGMKRAGETLSYRRDGNDVEVTLNDDSLAYIRMRPAAP
jgi:outer membrane protein assembly factor BamE (lipoprotein component of BamABCDE complex)